MRILTIVTSLVNAVGFRWGVVLNCRFEKEEVGIDGDSHLQTSLHPLRLQVWLGKGRSSLVDIDSPVLGSAGGCFVVGDGPVLSISNRGDPARVQPPIDEVVADGVSALL